VSAYPVAVVRATVVVMRDYTRAERVAYVPPPCPHCGGRRIRVTWQNVSEDDTPDAWALVKQVCLDCAVEPAR